MIHVQFNILYNIYNTELKFLWENCLAKFNIKNVIIKAEYLTVEYESLSK